MPPLPGAFTRTVRPNSLANIADGAIEFIIALGSGMPIFIAARYYDLRLRRCLSIRRGMLICLPATCLIAIPAEGSQRFASVDLFPAHRGRAV